MAEQASRGRRNLTRDVQMAKVSEITDIPEDLRRKASKKVAELTVRDLEDLALQLQGVPTHNKKIEDISYEELETLEELFQGYKRAKFEKLQSTGSLAAAAMEQFCDYTCCCCTPCCCCAAADVEPFAS